MSNKKLNIFRTVMLILGLGVIYAIFRIVNNPVPEDGLTAEQKLFWVDLAVCYAVFFIPFFFTTLKSSDAVVKINSLTGMWVSIILFEIVTIVFGILTLNKIIAVRFTLILELIVFFAAALISYLGCVVGNQVQNVDAQQSQLKASVNELKSALQMLNVQCDSWGENQECQKNAAKNLCEEGRYLAPVESNEAKVLEGKILSVVRSLCHDSMDAAEKSSKISEAENLLKMRKTYRS